MTNLFADDAMIYASGDSVSEVQRKLEYQLMVSRESSENY